MTGPSELFIIRLWIPRLQNCIQLKMRFKHFLLKEKFIAVVEENETEICQ